MTFATETATARHAVPRTGRHQPGMDLEGLSSLTLLATAVPKPRVLFLTHRDEAALQSGVAEGAHQMAVRLRGWTELPLREGSADSVLIDLDAVSGAMKTRSQVLDEIRRVLQPHGCCVAVVSHRRTPRDRSDLRKYRFTAPIKRWLPLFEAAQLEQQITAVLRFNGVRLVEIHMDGLSRTRGSGEAGDAVAIVLTGDGASRGRSVIDTIVDAVGKAIGRSTSLERLLVRKIGKTAAFLRADDAKRVVARIPRSSIALARASRNYQALAAVRSQTTIRPLVPRPVLQTLVGGYEVFVEERLPGKPRRSTIADDVSWEPQGLRFIGQLHLATAVRTTLSHTVYQRLVADRVRLIEPYCETLADREALQLLAELLRQRLLGDELPLVRTHGDFTGENCLYDPAGELCGVIDWELSSTEALPLLDLLQSMDIAGESNTHPRWQRADIVLDAVERTGPLAAAPEIQHYVAAMNIDPGLVPMLLLMYWVDHVSSRVEARASDRTWMERRMRQPLARIGGIGKRLQTPNA